MGWAVKVEFQCTAHAKPKGRFNLQVTPMYFSVDCNISWVVLVGEPLVVRMYCCVLPLAACCWTKLEKSFEVLLRSGPR